MAKRTQNKNVSKKAQNTDSDETISVCDIMKTNTSRIIKKLEMQIPFSIQMYSDHYKTYLHSLDDVFGTCLIAEKQLLDKMGIDPKVLKNFQKMSDDMTTIMETQIEVLNNMQKSQLQVRAQMMKAYEYYVHYMMDSYAKYLSTLNSNLKSSN